MDKKPFLVVFDPPHLNKIKEKSKEKGISANEYIRRATEERIAFDESDFDFQEQD